MSRTALGYNLITALNAALVVLAALIGSGKVPIPSEFVWAAPVLVVFLTNWTQGMEKLCADPKA